MGNCNIIRHVIIKKKKKKKIISKKKCNVNAPLGKIVEHVCIVRLSEWIFYI